LKNFLGIGGQLLRICKLPSKSSKMPFTEKVFRWMTGQQLKSVKLNKNVTHHLQKKCLKNISMKKVVKKISMMKTLMRHRCPFFFLMKMILWRTPLTWLINTLMISYMSGGIDGMWFVSLLTRIPFATLKVVLKQKGLSCRLQRIGLHAYMIQMLDILVMI
jgi:hypothetical protein